MLDTGFQMQGDRDGFVQLGNRWPGATLTLRDALSAVKAHSRTQRR